MFGTWKKQQQQQKLHQEKCNILEDKLFQIVTFSGTIVQNTELNNLKKEDNNYFKGNVTKLNKKLLNLKKQPILMFYKELQEKLLTL